jgi:hypothetical protein
VRRKRHPSEVERKLAEDLRRRTCGCRNATHRLRRLQVQPSLPGRDAARAAAGAALVRALRNCDAARLCETASSQLKKEMIRRLRYTMTKLRRSLSPILGREPSQAREELEPSRARRRDPHRHLQLGHRLVHRGLPCLSHAPGRGQSGSVSTWRAPATYRSPRHHDGIEASRRSRRTRSRRFHGARGS